jgi:hypothetical protein
MLLQDETLITDWQLQLYLGMLYLYCQESQRHMTNYVQFKFGNYSPIYFGTMDLFVTVFARLNAGIVGSNPTKDMGISLQLFYVCVGSGHATGWSSVQGVLQNDLGLSYWSETKRFTDALCTKLGATGERERKRVPLIRETWDLSIIIRLRAGRWENWQWQISFPIPMRFWLSLTTNQPPNQWELSFRVMACN